MLNMQSQNNHLTNNKIQLYIKNGFPQFMR